ncbi:malonate transporter subunit MadL [Rudanella paleaurantiibacter]|uniref:Malonate transporter subunit MadL n=1 Tax=Rudanella paleaurantiibacter TaxID=2614655 RepID=A0A7J5TUF6_9BACT|nr:malonate transporter subunit MadL [Rudanella paleaurantiibacter]KAB7727640.1 malonate transporter subunit MadL [Rudanella paleaurantiibacter]
MIIYGVAILAFCYVMGQLAGELLGQLIGVDANVGGVGFAMLLLILFNDWFTQKGYTDRLTEGGIQFWSQMYIPIVVAMSATQNVKVAVSSGLIAVLAGVVPVLLCGAVIPLLAKLTTPKTTEQHGAYRPVS